MDKDVLHRMTPPGDRASYELSRRKAFGIAAKLGLGGAAAAAAIGGGGLRGSFAPGGHGRRRFAAERLQIHLRQPRHNKPVLHTDPVRNRGRLRILRLQLSVDRLADLHVTEMVSAMQTAIADKVDGIAVCLVDAEAFNKPTDDALSIGIPVIAYNADTHPECPARLRWPEPVSVRLQHRPEMAADGETGRQGDAFHRHARFAEPAAETRRLHPGDQGRRRLRSPTTRLQPVSIRPTQESTIEAYYLANKDVVGFFGTGATDSLAVGKLSQKYGLAAQGVITAGYDLLPETIALVGSGDMTFTTDQQPYLQGFIPTLQLYLYKLSGGAVSPANTDTSLAYVTKDNVRCLPRPVPIRGQHRRGSGVVTEPSTDG